MVRRHWLDPLARRLLVATGQLPAEPLQTPRSAVAPPQRRAGPECADQAEHAEQVERDLLALKLKANPGLRLRHADEVRHAAALGWSLDVNRATAADWLRLPGCTADQADLLLRAQASGLQLCGPEDLQQLLAVPEAQIRAWLPLLAFRWYGEPPLASPPPLPINQASEALVQQRLGLNPERSRRLIQERSGRPFRDLADLQQRLQLPVALVEQWIGRLSFQPGQASPQLPPPPRRRART